MPSDLTLDRVHEVIQTSMGWTNSHLHTFLASPDSGLITPILTPFDEEEGDEGLLEADVRIDHVLARTGDTLDYDYDFGDNWNHRLTLESITDREDTDLRVRCVAGERKCPPEDVGGLGWYETLLEAAANPSPRVGEEYRDQIRFYDIDPLADHFDLAATNSALDRDAGAMEALNHFRAQPASSNFGLALKLLLETLSPEAELLIAGYFCVASDGAAEQAISEEDARRGTKVFRDFLDLVGDDGIALTDAGFLPPAAVTRMMNLLDPSHQWLGASNREAQTRPLHELRAAATHLGLTRKYKNTLSVTARGKILMYDPLQLWKHLTANIPTEKVDVDRDVAALALLLVANGAVTGSVAFTKDLDLLVAMVGWNFDGPGRYGNNYAFFRARATSNILLWVGTGQLFTLGSKNNAGTISLAQLLALTALREAV